MRQTQHPLTNWYVRKDTVNEMRGALRHAAAAAARTERAALAGEGHKATEPTRAAAKPRETTRKPAALEKVPKRPLHERRQSLAVTKLGRMRPERFKVVSDDLVQNVCAWRPRLVLGRGQRHGRASRRDAASWRASGTAQNRRPYAEHWQNLQRVGQPRLQFLQWP